MKCRTYLGSKPTKQVLWSRHPSNPLPRVKAGPRPVASRRERTRSATGSGDRKFNQTRPFEPMTGVQIPDRAFCEKRRDEQKRRVGLEQTSRTQRSERLDEFESPTEHPDGFAVAQFLAVVRELIDYRSHRRSPSAGSTTALRRRAAPSKDGVPRGASTRRAR